MAACLLAIVMGTTGCSGGPLEPSNVSHAEVQQAAQQDVARPASALRKDLESVTREDSVALRSDLEAIIARHWRDTTLVPTASLDTGVSNRCPPFEPGQPRAACVEAPSVSIEGLFCEGDSRDRCMDVRSLVGKKGFTNAGIFRADPSRIIKLYERESRATIMGNLLADLAGGTEIYGFGTVTTPGGRFMFIEMEELFPDSGFSHWKADPAGFARLLNDPSHLEDLAKMIRAADDLGIWIRDRDIAFNERGEMRWFDGDLWELEVPGRGPSWGLQQISERLPLERRELWQSLVEKYDLQINQ